MHTISIKSDSIEYLLRSLWQGSDSKRLRHHESTRYRRNLSVISSDPHIYAKQIFGCLLLLVVIIIYVSVKAYTRQRRELEKKTKSIIKSKSKSKGNSSRSSEEDMVDTVIEEFEDLDDDIICYDSDGEYYLDLTPKRNSRYALIFEEKEEDIIDSF